MRVRGRSSISFGIVLLFVGLLLIISVSLIAWLVRAVGIVLIVVAIVMIISGLMGRGSRSKSRGG